MSGDRLRSLSQTMTPVNDRRKSKTDASKRLNNHFVQAQNTATADLEYMKEV